MHPEEANAEPVRRVSDRRAAIGRPEGSLAHIPPLDGLRAVAVGSVLLLHGTYSRISGGFLGVDLFFVLSGYLITRILCADLDAFGRVRLGRFYLRRVRRLYPALVGVVLLSAALWSRSGIPAEARWGKAVTAVLLYYGNFIPFSLGNLAHTWSLSVEEQFYFVWPLLLTAAWLRTGKAGRVMVPVAGALAAMVLRAWWYAIGWPHGGQTLYFLTPARIDTLLLGSVAGAYIAGYGVPRWFRGTAAKAASFAIAGLYLALLVTARYTDAWLLLGGFTTLASVFAVWILLLAHGAPTPLTRALSHPALVWVGRRSYGIYLYHFPLFMALEPYRVPGSAANFVGLFVVFVTATVLVAAASYRWVEAPILRWTGFPARAPDPGRPVARGAAPRG